MGEICLGKLIKNIEHGVVLPLADEVAYQTGQVVSKTLAQNGRHSLTLFAFEKGEEISSHASEGAALMLVLDGVGKVTIDGKEHLLHVGGGYCYARESSSCRICS